MASKKYGTKFLKGFRQFRVPPKLEALAIERYLRSLDCPRALTILIMYRNNEHAQLAKLEFDPLCYSNWVALRDAYAATKFLSKFKGLSLGYDLDVVAKEKFRDFELLCERTNYRFRRPELDPFRSDLTAKLHKAVKRKISSILGLFSAEEFFLYPNWGPGASTRIPKRRASSQEKFQCETGITRDLHALIPIGLIHEKFPRWAQQLERTGYPTFQLGNKVITVPKDATTNRVIAVEPGINLWFQQSIGTMIKRRLLRVGIDFTSQKRNQDLALAGSKYGELATIDLSSASDSIASSVVEDLIPLRWLLVMDACRTKFGQLDGEVIKWEKFSSMGNGFTFPLQTLIFFAIASCCKEYLRIDGDVSAYGDDVIIPTSAFKLFAEMVAFYGFQLNEKKSHFSSTFRESCGAHYCSGFDVKPIYLKDKVTSVPAIYRLANSFRRLASRRNFGVGCDTRLRSAFELLVRSVPIAFRFQIPEILGDGGFVSNFDEATPSRIRHKPLKYKHFLGSGVLPASEDAEGYFVYHATNMDVIHEDDRFGYLLAELWRISDRTGIEDFSEKRPTLLKAIQNITWAESDVLGRNSVTTHKAVWGVSKSSVRQWTDLGPWS